MGALGETGKNWEDGGRADDYRTGAQSNINYELAARNTLTARTGMDLTVIDRDYWGAEYWGMMMVGVLFLGWDLAMWKKWCNFAQFF